MDTTELELEILELEEKLKKSRNPVEKADAESRIANLKKKIKESKNMSIDKPVILQKDVPVRIDHNDDSVSNRQITNTGNVFTTIL